ncbi:Polyribonucleotide nucleotidyltransferase [Streptomyces fumanus]
MVLEGVVTNVAALGFVDVGVHQDGLVHVSAMSKTFVKDPRDVVKPGDIVKVKVLDVDIPRKRISLTLRLDDEAAARESAGRAGASGPPGSGRPPAARAAGGARGQRGDGRRAAPGRAGVAGAGGQRSVTLPSVTSRWRVRRTVPSIRRSWVTRRSVPS